MKRIYFFLLLQLFLINTCLIYSQVKTDDDKVADVVVNFDKTIHTMQGGIGASWHAMGPDVIYYPNLIGRDNRACKGSAYGGNPPVVAAYDSAWHDVYRHMAWLGLDFVRVEIAMDMYNPEKNVYDWENKEMLTLYRILDYCESKAVDVYLTMQWNGVEWNAHPGINPLQSSPKSVEDYAVSYATLVEHLVKNKKYSCIHWMTLNNEPGMGVGWWQGPDGKPESIMPAMRATRAELDKRNLQHIALCGSDGHGIFAGQFDPYDKSVGALSIHCYWGKPEEMFKEGVKISEELNLPFFIAEMGTFFMGEFEGEQMAMGGPRSEAPKSYGHQLINAEKILVGLNMGVDGFSRWSFTNRGDLDGQWQLVRTWNPNLWDFKKRVEPEIVPYYSYGIITRFAAKHSSVLETIVNNQGLITTALKSPAGEITIYLLNQSDQAINVNLSCNSVKKPISFKTYQVTDEALSNADFKFTHVAIYEIDKKNNTLVLSIPSKSITALTTYQLGATDEGIF